MYMKKEGLSPVIATVLLISLAIVLALIVLIWARNFIGEQALKFGEPVENACDDVGFIAEAEIRGGELVVDVNNIGNVPIYGLEIRKIGSGSKENIGYNSFPASPGGSEQGLSVGAGKSINFGSSAQIDDSLNVVPIILGETDAYKKPYTCDEAFAQPVTVI
jgi:hypothetical protein